MRMLRLLALAPALIATPAAAQWQVPDHSVPVGRGAGFTGFKNAAPGTTGFPLTSNGASTDPSFQALTGAAFGAQTANTVWAGPAAAGPTAPTFRALVAADLPTVPVNKGGTGAITAALARVGLNVESVTTFTNANIGVTITDRVIATTATNFTAARTATLPSIATYNPGQSVVIVDSGGAINGANTLTITANGSDTINGAASIVITTQYSGAVLYPIGANKWGYIASSGGGGGVTNVATAGILTGGPITTSGTLNVNATITPQLRITLTSATPVMTTSVAGATTVYCTPYAGNIVPIYDGTNFVPTAFTEVSQTTTDTTKSPAAVAASKVYDLFSWNDGGTPRCTRGPAWTNSSTRGYTFTVVNGIALNTSAITNGPAASRGVWVGTIASNASSTIDYIFGFPASGGGASVLNVWNVYNKVATTTNVVDNAATYQYQTFTTRQARASAGNQISFVVGDQSNAIQYSYSTEVDAIANLASTQIGVGFDTTTAFSGPGSSFMKNSGTGDFLTRSMVVGTWAPAAGTHFLSANEKSDGTNMNYFDNNSLATLSATIWN